MPRAKYVNMDLTGKRFGKFTVVEQATPKYGRPHWLCQCDCGNTATVNYQSLVRGLSKSCGCVGRKKTAKRNLVHGKTATPEYNSWRGMKGRCYDPKHMHYEKYGGRGIRICSRWHKDFESFLADVGLKPSPKHSIDRIDNDQHYSCGHCEECLRKNWLPNCRWASQRDQVNNQRATIKVMYNGTETLLKEVARLTGISYSTLYQRYQKGWPLIK